MTGSLKRLAWCYGTAPKGTDEEAQSLDALLSTILESADRCRQEERDRVLAGVRQTRRTVVYPALRRTLERVAGAYGLTPRDMYGRDRRLRVARVRQLAMALCRETGASYPEIGVAFSRDHTTVMAACRKVAKSPSMQAELEVLRRGGAGCP